MARAAYVKERELVASRIKNVEESLLSHWKGRVQETISDMFDNGRFDSKNLELPKMLRGSSEARTGFMAEFIVTAFCLAEERGLKTFINEVEFQGDGHRMMLYDEANEKAKEILISMDGKEGEKSIAVVTFSFVPEGEELF